MRQLSLFEPWNCATAALHTVALFHAAEALTALSTMFTGGSEPILENR
jgi:hypothetical protein